MSESQKIRAVRRILQTMFCVLALAVPVRICTDAGRPDLSGTEIQADAEAVAGTSSKTAVYLGGMPVGIYMETDGVMVLSTEQVRRLDGSFCDPSSGRIKTGDYITAVDHCDINGKDELLEAVEKAGSDEIILTLRRGRDTLDVGVRPAEYESGRYRMGIWVRDNVQGLGTVTFFTEDNHFGALGHGIHDIDTNELMTIDSGRIYRTSIRDITKGHSGTPGTMEGVIVYNNYNVLGRIFGNTDAGIYGTLDRAEDLFGDPVRIETAGKEDIHTGDALIRCCVDGEMKDYDICVTDIDMSGGEINKGIVIRVTDPELLGKTGGIIQGMSGSPIIQDGRLIGAVTHVFVRDATKGYGIFIENMLDCVGFGGLSNNMSN